MGKKIELWIVLLIVWFGLVFTIVFGWSIKSELIGSKRAGIFGEIAYKISSFPSKVFGLYVHIDTKAYQPLILKNRWLEINGFSKYGKINQNVYNDKGYLLLSAFSDKKQQSTVKLIRISDQHIIHEWIPSIDQIEELHKEENLNKFGSEKFNLLLFTKKRFRIIHPLLLKDGSLVFSERDSRLIKISKNSELVWLTSYTHHHSIEQDIDGNIWTAIRNFPTVYDTIIENYRDDAIALVNMHGEVIYKKSVTEILIENGYQGLVWGVGPVELDPLHLNDIQPALFSSKYWEVGDLLISLRHRSTIFLYRPQSNKILWLKTGPWLNQHDADFISESKISVFGNDVYRVNDVWGGKLFSKSNNVYIYDFEKDTIITPYSSILEELDVRTPTEGHSEILGNGDVFIEETDYGRALRISADDVKWEFTSTIDSGHVGLVSLSRYLLYDQISKILPILEER